MPITYGYVRTSRPRVSELSGSDPETQRQQLLAADVVLSYIYQDIGISGTSGTKQLAGLALTGLPAGPRRHLGCGVHRPHRAALEHLPGADAHHTTDEEGPGHVPGPKPRVRACRNRWCGGY